MAGHRRAGCIRRFSWPLLLLALASFLPSAAAVQTTATAAPVTLEMEQGFSGQVRMTFRVETACSAITQQPPEFLLVDDNADILNFSARRATGQWMATSSFPPRYVANFDLTLGVERRENATGAFTRTTQWAYAGPFPNSQCVTSQSFEPYGETVDVITINGTVVFREAPPGIGGNHLDPNIGPGGPAGASSSLVPAVLGGMAAYVILLSAGLAVLVQRRRRPPESEIEPSPPDE
jgi:hypothetical protein